MDDDDVDDIITNHNSIQPELMKSDFHYISTCVCVVYVIHVVVVALIIVSSTI